MESLARRAAAPAFAVSLLITAALLFAVQPLIGRMVTPLLGGSPAVWNTSLVFFQAALLLGYLYAHLLAKLPSLPMQALIHGIVLALAWLVLPLHVSTLLGAPSSEQPAFWLLGVLIVSAGAPFTAMSATAPLLQSWLARTDRGDAEDPYYLYAASNFGSFVGLLAYPIVVEPLIGLSEQAGYWTLGYVISGVTVAAVALIAVSLHKKEGASAPQSPAPTRADRLYWIAAAAIPSSLILGVTQHISTDVASAPFLWVLPLALYLLTFVIAFARGTARFAPLVSFLQPLALALLVLSYFMRGDIIWAVAANLSCFFLSALVCHFALAASRPPADRLTEFYLWVSVGGAVGGGLTALVAPLIFNDVYEYPLALAALAFFRPRMGGAPFKIDQVAAASAFVMALMVFALLLRESVEVALFGGGLGAAAALVAAAVSLSDDRPTPSQLVFLFASLAFAALMTVSLFVPQMLLRELQTPEGVHAQLNTPMGPLVLGSALIILALVIQAAFRRKPETLSVDRVSIPTGSIARVALGAAIPTLSGLILLLLTSMHFTQNGLVAVGLAAAAVALWLNRGRPVVYALLVLSAFSIVFVRDRTGGHVVEQLRSFFGVIRVSEYTDRRVPNDPILRVMMHGTTIHGAQIHNLPGAQLQPLTYYNPYTALGEATLAGISTGESSNVALIGLGTGTTACLLRPADRLTVYEIDPTVLRISASPNSPFSYLRECPAHASTRIVLGDARLRIAEAPRGAYDVIVVDAFSSDAIPAHLLTQEAIATYLSRTSDRGIVVLHLSNRNLALVAEASRVANALRVPYVWWVSARIDTGDAAGPFGGLPASAMVIARTPEILGGVPLRSQGWRALMPLPGRAWSDDYINLPRAFWEAMTGQENCWEETGLLDCGRSRAPPPAAPPSQQPSQSPSR